MHQPFVTTAPPPAPCVAWSSANNTLQSHPYAPVISNHCPPPTPPTTPLHLQGWAGDSGANVQGSDLLSSPAVPGKYWVSDITQIYYSNLMEWAGLTLSRSMQRRAFSRAVMDEKAVVPTTFLVVPTTFLVSGRQCLIMSGALFSWFLPPDMTSCVHHPEGKLKSVFWKIWDSHNFQYIQYIK